MWAIKDTRRGDWVRESRFQAIWAFEDSEKANEVADRLEASWRMDDDPDQSRQFVILKLAGLAQQ